jgi:alpha-ketoglutarate-dependent taurine dioxygenase
MKYKLHKNGWTVFADIDLNTASLEDLYELAVLCANYVVVKVRNQRLSIEREAEIIKSYKDPYVLFRPDHARFKHTVLDKEGYVGRVTGQIDRYGVSGIAGHKEEMLWHHESPAERGQSSIAWLYSESGTEKSVTIWNNTIEAYKDLDDSLREKIKDLKVIQFTNISQNSSKLLENMQNRKVHEHVKTPLVYTNQAGKTGLHLSITQFERFDGMTREESLEIAEPLFKFITQDKYCYYHEWCDGDVSMSDQWLGVHKRLYFDNMEGRLVHRATFDYPDNLNYHL